MKTALATAPGSLEEDDQPRALWERAIGWLVVAICTVLVLRIMNPEMRLWPLWDGRLGYLFADTTTNGGDMGAHVWLPQFLRDHWFGELRLSGWAPSWYAGFPAGHYYFPLPALMIAALDAVPFVSYNVAFKLVTATGPLLLPWSAYAFARGIRAPWPAPPAFAVAAFGTLVQTRSQWQIYGGNIASTLAGEYSFTIALAFGLFGLGALARTLDTGRRRWLPAVLIAAAAMSHVVVSFFVALIAILLFLTRRPWRTWPVAGLVGATAVALTGVWSIPLLLRHDYTQSMRYTRLVTNSDWSLPAWMAAPDWLPGHGLVDALWGPVVRTIEGIVRSTGIATVVAETGSERYLRLPWWIWVLGGIAVVAAGWYRRRSTFVLLVSAVVLGVLFVQWPEHAVWNARWLPFWLLSWGFLAAMGATELLRWAAGLAAWSVRWIGAGDAHDARARRWVELARDDTGEVDPELRRQAVDVVATRRFDVDPPGFVTPVGLTAAQLDRRARRTGRLALAALVLVVAVVPIHGALWRAWDARDDNPEISIAGWAAWNYRGYEEKAAWPEYRRIMDVMGALPPGRALWEPSSMEGDPINNYGTSLALMLLPYWTDGRIGSMEGLYFESSATTSFHFLTVSELAAHPSNPVRGLHYGTLEDFDRGVRHLQMLGVRYYMAWSPEAVEKADAHRALDLVAEVPDLDGNDPKGWRVYEVRGHTLVEGLEYEPVVASVEGGDFTECWDQEWNDTVNAPPELGGWECDAGRWWRDGTDLDLPWVADGPEEWARVDAGDLGAAPRTPLPAVEVRDIREEVDRISFSVDRVGVPVVVKASYFPNWELSGARGPYRLAPNLMVVVPTENEVTLTYGLTGVDWLGRILTLSGIAGLVVLVVWRGARRFAADPGFGDPGFGDPGFGEGGPPGGGGPDEGGPDDDWGDAGPGEEDHLVASRADRSEPAPALP